MAIQTKYQTPEEISKICTQWVQHVAPVNFPGYEDSRHNGDLLHAYVRANGGAYSLAILTEAAQHYKSNLHGCGVQHSAEHRAITAEKAEAERLQKITEQNQNTIVRWLKTECPLGLIVNGDLFGTTQDKMVAFIRRNYPKYEVLTPAMLSEAVTVLGDALDFFSAAPEDRVLRNQPAPASRESKLSDRAKREAGLLPIERQQPSHAVTDGRFKTPEDLIRFMANEELRRKGVTSSPIMAEANAIVVQGKRGKVDPVKSAEIRKILVYTNGKLDEIATLRTRNKAAEKYERDKNQI